MIFVFYFQLTSLSMLQLDPSRLLQLVLLSPLSCLSVDINNFFIRPPINRHLDCFHGLAVVNNAAVSTEVHVSF